LIEIFSLFLTNLHKSSLLSLSCSSLPHEFSGQSSSLPTRETAAVGGSGGGGWWSGAAAGRHRRRRRR